MFFVNLPFGIVTVLGLLAFMDECVYPAEPRFDEEMEKNRHDGNPWRPSAVVVVRRRSVR